MPVGRVHVVGSVNVDVVLPVAALPAPGATILSGDPVRTGGGKGANAAVAAARDGADVRLVAAVGRDHQGDQSLADLAADGVGTDQVAVLDDRPTGMAMICVDARGENFIVVAAGANAALTPAHVAAGLRGAGPGDVCIVSFEIPDDAAVAAVVEAAAAGARVLVNPSPVRDLAPDLLGAAPSLVLNAGEVRSFTGCDDVADGARALRARGCDAVVVTLGADGARVFGAGGTDTRVAPFAARPADTTGAGDTFTGVLAGGLARGAGLADAARRAAAAAALSTERMGARAAMPRSADIERLLSGV